MFSAWVQSVKELGGSIAKDAGNASHVAITTEKKHKIILDCQAKLFLQIQCHTQTIISEDYVT